ncbi:hypothetical protein B0J13DRAFT_455887 [Dactylonectria estremocensis]|uniref:LysM domain-containing protein n=1 Tax=Dactylonectria estremocensis TaxID=1079267 RepID=A0A9P9IK93_9HYPO|nr:hypothetical protein B0J13DRAFT_455887 [Dactylonectria estremocensis]
MGPLQAVRLALATLLVINSAVSADECQPETWRLRALRPGDINCRLSTVTEPKVDSKTCAFLANKYHTTVDTFLDLNPGLDRDCDSIEPDTRYCVEGCKLKLLLVYEPLRASNGLCGPDNGNATCVGTDKQCCNKITWKCGDTTYV